MDASDNCLRSTDEGSTAPIHLAHGSLPVPQKHGVDGLAKLSAAALVDAAGVDLDIRNARLAGFVARHLNLLPSGLSSCAPEIFHVLKTDFVLSPCG